MAPMATVAAADDDDHDGDGDGSLVACCFGVPVSRASDPPSPPPPGPPVPLPPVASWRVSNSFFHQPEHAILQDQVSSATATPSERRAQCATRTNGRRRSRSRSRSQPTRGRQWLPLDDDRTHARMHALTHSLVVLSSSLARPWASMTVHRPRLRVVRPRVAAAFLACACA